MPDKVSVVHGIAYSESLHFRTRSLDYANLLITHALGVWRRAKIGHEHVTLGPVGNTREPRPHKHLIWSRDTWFTDIDESGLPLGFKLDGFVYNIRSCANIGTYGDSAGPSAPHPLGNPSGRRSHDFTR